MTTPRKVAITGIFLLGLLSTAGALTRMAIQILSIYDTKENSRDILGDQTNVVVWSLVEAISYNRGEVVRTLVEHSIDYHYQTPKSNQRILHHAAYYAEVENMEALLAVKLVGLDVNAKDNEGCTALDLLGTSTPKRSMAVLNAFDRLLKQIRENSPPRSTLSNEGY